MCVAARVRQSVTIRCSSTISVVTETLSTMKITFAVSVLCQHCVQEINRANGFWFAIYLIFTGVEFVKALTNCLFFS